MIVIEFVWNVFTSLLGLAVVLTFVVGVPMILVVLFQDGMDADRERRDRHKRLRERRGRKW